VRDRLARNEIATHSPDPAAPHATTAAEGDFGMKREAIAHTKMARLCQALNILIYHAVGLIEMLLKLVERETPQGNIGKLTDEAIGGALGYEGDPHVLVQAFVSSGWLDEHPVHRLVMHDFSEHAEDFVHMRLARARLFFSDGKPPKFKRLPTEERVAAQRFYDATPSPASLESVRTENTHGVSTDSAHVPCADLHLHLHQDLDLNQNQKPNPLPPSRKPSGKAAAREPRANRVPKSESDLLPFAAEIAEIAQKIHDRHPVRRRCGFGEVVDMLKAIMKRTPEAERDGTLGDIDDNHRRLCATEDWTKENFQYAPGLSKWLRPSRGLYLEPQPMGFEEEFDQEYLCWEIYHPGATREDFVASGEAPKPKPVQSATGKVNKPRSVMEGV